jgi:crossover junction endodeoxyribonuclease RusA
MPEWVTFVPGVPRPQGSLTLARNPRTGKEFARYSGPTVAWRQTLHGALSQWWQQPPVEGPVAVEFTFWMPRPKAHYSARGGLKASAPVWHVSQFDLDKMCRAVDDALTDAGVWLDDGQVASLLATKRYVAVGGRPGVAIRLKEAQE